MPIAVPDHDREVQTFTILKGTEGQFHHHCGSGDGECGGEGHNHSGVEPIRVDEIKGVDRSLLSEALGSLPKESIWRVKGFVRLLPEHQVYILNWAFGRYELHLCDTQNVSPVIQITVMGKRGEMKRSVHRFADQLGASVRA